MNAHVTDPNAPIVHKSHLIWFVILVVVLVIVVVLWQGKTNSSPEYMKAANAPAQNPGLTGVSDQYRAGIEAARNAPASTQQQTPK